MRAASLDSQACPTLGSLDVHVWRIALDAPRQDVSRLRHLLSDDERARADRFRFEKHRRRFIVRRGATRLILARYTSLDPAAQRFDIDANGKPFLAGASLQFNRSHSGELALLAVSRDRRLGVDIERIDPGADVNGIADACFSESERWFLGSVPEPRRAVAFYAVWTRKEAIVKATGEGLVRARDRVEVRPTRPATTVRHAGSQWKLIELSPGSAWAAALAVESGDVRVTNFDWKECV